MDPEQLAFSAARRLHAEREEAVAFGFKGLRELGVELRVAARDPAFERVALHVHLSDVLVLPPVGEAIALPFNRKGGRREEGVEDAFGNEGHALVARVPRDARMPELSDGLTFHGDAEIPELNVFHAGFLCRLALQLRLDHAGREHAADDHVASVLRLEHPIEVPHLRPEERFLLVRLRHGAVLADEDHRVVRTPRAVVRELSGHVEACEVALERRDVPEADIRLAAGLRLDAARHQMGVVLLSCTGRHAPVVCPADLRRGAVPCHGVAEKQDFQRCLRVSRRTQRDHRCTCGNR